MSIDSHFLRFRQYGARMFFAFVLSEIRIRLINPIFFGSYSQFGEDLWLDNYFHNKKKGFYIDIGAYDPYRFSNTMRFYKRGWSGINIEPNTSLWQKFLRERSRDINLNLGVASKKGALTLYTFDPPTITTFSKKQADTYKKQGFHLRNTTKVEVTSVREIVETFASEKIIDFMSIDVEGLEMEVLRGIDWKKMQPKIICIESAVWEDGGVPRRDKSLDTFLRAKKYRCVHETGLNSFYERNK